MRLISEEKPPIRVVFLFALRLGIWTFTPSADKVGRREWAWSASARGARWSERDKGENKEQTARASANELPATIFSSGPFKSHLRNQLVRPKMISHEKPEIFSGFLRFSPFFSLFWNFQNSQNKKISSPENDWSEGFELPTSPFWHNFQRFLSKKRTKNEAINC